MSPPSATSLALLRLLADGGWRSGVDLAQQLGLSRAAVSKQAQSLARWGVDVQTERARGYRLSPALDLLDLPRLRQALARSAAAGGSGIRRSGAICTYPWRRPMRQDRPPWPD